MADLKAILRAELSRYAGEGANCIMLPIFDDDHQTYAINAIDYPTRKQIAGVAILARILGDKIVIEEDMTDKKLADTLEKAGVPRNQIIRAYADEILLEPELP